MAGAGSRHGCIAPGGAQAAAGGAMRRILMLQGPSNGFLARLAAALEARGAQARKVIVHPGEALFWRRPGAVHFRARAEDWPGWIARLLGDGVTDLVLLGDRRPGHPEAIAAAKALGVAVHHLELGLLRPGRLGHEPDGPGARFPRDAAGVRALAARVRAAGGAPPPGPRGAGFAAYAAMDVAWNLGALAAPLTHPGYRRHHIHHPLVEYAAWARKLALGPAARARGAARRRAWGLEGAGAPPGPVFLFALQLRGDSQVRFRGAGADLRAVAERVARSFAAHAPRDALLLAKPHPMDNRLTGWAATLSRAAGAASGRVAIAEGGDLAAMLRRAAGMVTVNSGAGLEAALAGTPVKPLGRAVWDMEGVTHQGDLDGFWQAPRLPDPDLAEDLRTALDWAAHVPGGFDGPAAALGAEALADRILAPPRL